MSNYEGYARLAGASGNYASMNSLDKVSASAWSNNPSRSTIKLSSRSAKGETYYMYTCAMQRPLFSQLSTWQVKLGSTVDWIYGFKVFSSKGDFTVDFGDSVKGQMILFDGSAMLALGASAALICWHGEGLVGLRFQEGSGASQ